MPNYLFSGPGPGEGNMKCIILAAGYGTRLFPLSKDYPKSLLKVGDKEVLDYLLEKTDTVENIEKVFIVINNKFAPFFEEYLSNKNFKKEIELINDGTNSNRERMGAIKDLSFAVNNKAILDDILVLGGDNILDFSFSSFVKFFRKKKSDVIAAYRAAKNEDLSFTGVVKIEVDGKVVNFQEKPSCPESDFVVPPCYIFQKETLSEIGKYLAENNLPDAPGNFIKWLSKRKEVYAFIFNGKRYDIGNLSSYRKTVKEFEK
jgi:glucose-1-phosphate thymidylyltransferase